MIDCILSALVQYERKKIFLSDIRTERILVQQTDSEHTIYKIGLPKLMNNTTMSQ